MDVKQFWTEVDEEFGLLTAAHVSLLLSSTPDQIDAAELWAAGKLFAVKREGAIQYPGFQIADGQIRPVIPRLVAVAKDLGILESSAIVWLCSPSSHLGDRRPVDLLDSDGETVILEARRAWGVKW